MEKAVGSRTSVHVGCFNNDHELMTCKDVELSADYHAVGIKMSMNANRLSWFFDFRGTSMNVDTALLTSMEGIVAGTNLILSADMMQVLSNVNMLSPDSRSYAFDHRANGYGRGEGTGTLVIKRLADAIRDGDTIRAVIRSAGSNQDGLTSSGIMQPNGTAQANLIRATYRKAGLSMKPTRFFEAHGTGTPVGDPIECNALGEVFHSVRSTDDPLIVGAVKSNIGHLEGASGIAAVIKTILILESGMIPPNTNFEKLNPKIDLELLNLKLPLAPTPWPTHGLRRASVNSFGFGGSNAHVVLDDAFHYLRDRGLVGNHVTAEFPPTLLEQEREQRQGCVESQFCNEIRQPTNLESPLSLLVLSSSSRASIKDVVTAYRSYFNALALPPSRIGSYIADLAHTLNTRRSALPYKCFWLASSLEDLRHVEEKASSTYQALEKPVLGFVFTGQGAQWAGMGRELFKYPAFRNSICECEIALRSFGCMWSLQDEILNDDGTSRIHEPELAQPANTALQIALVDLLDSVGISPAAVIGHSSGEIAAAYTLGALSIVESMEIAYFRGVCAAELARKREPAGAMVAVKLSERNSRIYIDEVSRIHGCQRINVACINSPKSVTISGDTSHVETLIGLLDDNKIFARKLKVPVAYHSFHMKHVSPAYREHMKDLRPDESRSCRGVMVSSVTGQIVDSAQLRSSEYWINNLVSPVQFAQSLLKICTESGRKIRKKLDLSHRSQIGVNILLEIGPHATLQGPIRDLAETLSWGQDINYVPAIRRGESAAKTFLDAIGQLHCLGCPVNLESVNKLSGVVGKRQRVLVDLPQYPFNHSTSYWRESRISKESRIAKQGRLDLLGKPVVDWNPLEARWRHHIRCSELPWVEDHVINGALIYPAAGMLVMAIEAANQTADSGRNVMGFQLKDVKFKRALTVPKTADGVETNLLLRTLKDSNNSNVPWLEFRLCSFESSEWHENCHGFIKVDYYVTSNKLQGGSHELEDCLQQDDAISQACVTNFNPKQLYECLNSSGFEFGPAFRTIIGGKCNSLHQARSLIKVFPWTAEQYPQPHVVHPTTLDGIFHLTAAALSEGGQIKLPTAIPTGIRNLWVDGIQSTVVADRTREIGNQNETTPTSYHVTRVPDLEPLHFFRDLNFVLYKFLDQALKELGDTNVEAVPAHISRYTQWARLQRSKYEMGRLPLSRPEWTELLQDPEYFDTACNRVAAENNQGEVLIRTGRNLVPILRGEQDPLQFLFSGDTMVKFYQEVNNRPLCFDTWGFYLRTLAQGNPTMRILEIGAGTGGTTNHILHALTLGSGVSENSPLYITYDFTDISAAFFEKAAERYKKFPRINFKTLNIEDNPSLQGFELGSYDLIVAANVLHATPSILKTMHNVRALLKPGGKLMLYEVTRPEIIRSSFLTGLMEGWWAGEEEDRAWSPVLTSDQWDAVLRKTGFSGVDIEFPDFLDLECQEASILVTTASRSAVPRPVPQTIYFVIDASSAVQRKIYEEARILLQVQDPQLTVASGDLDLCAALPSLASVNLVFVQETETPLLSDMSRDTFTKLQHLVNYCNSILWVTAGGGQSPKRPEFSIVDGWARTLRSERSNRRLSTLALDIEGHVSKTQVSYIVRVLMDGVLDVEQETYEPEFVEIDGILHVVRIQPNASLSNDLHRASLPQQSGNKLLEEAGPVKLVYTAPGLHNTLQWTDDEENGLPLLLDEVEMEVKAVGLNFRDCQIALGKDPETTFGQECAGVVVHAGEASGFRPGDRVAAFGPGKFKTTARCKSDSMCKIPDSMPFTEAASIPAQFGAAWQAIVEIGRLRTGESILIHAGAGGSGQAAIQISQHIGAEVYATTSSQEKKEILMMEYNIPADHIFYSRDPTFAKGLMRKTNGHGVHMVMNNLGGEILLASIECIAPYGRLVDTHIKETSSSFSLPVALSGRQASYTHFDSARWVRDRPHAAKKAIETVIRLFEDQKLHVQKPLQVWSVSDIEESFRQMEGGTTVGKAVVELTPQAQVPTTLSTKVPFSLNPNATYVIAGGLGGLGRTMARWMATRGARHLVLLGRSGAKAKAAFELIEELEGQGVAVKAPPCDVTDSKSVRRVMYEITQTMPPIKGCVQGSMVLRDRMFHEMAYEEWRAATECKTLGSTNLEANLPRDLDFLVLLSSVSAIVGLPSQSNYAAGNSFMDGFARCRVAKGQKAISVDLGVMVDDGILVETAGLAEKVLEYGSLDPVSRSQFFSILDYYCNPEQPLLIPDEAQMIFGIASRADRYLGSTMVEKPLFRRLTLENASSDVSTEGGEDQRDFKKLFVEASSLQAAREVVTRALINKLKWSWRVVPEDTEVDVDAPLYTYRVDSLLAVELCNWIGSQFAADVTVLEVMGGATLAMVDIMVATRSQLNHPVWA
ncbi:hypothetical protein EYZ11_011749 [Aspergillus tanneri]|uniref:Uncharacterized protein n=1 Tax=Aspergillus tanneri TaxID=1220188 RepID=A0A4S3J202_9EURO|nr:hypothetical protein EYZ11_011749 [Aspergillus tanneri]